MSNLSQAASARGFPKSEERFPASGIVIPATRIIVTIARRMWPAKTAQHLASRANVSERAAKLWMEERGGIGAEALVELLRSDVGFELLSELMAGQRAPWWADVLRLARLAEIEKQQRALAAEQAAFEAEFSR